MGPWGAGPWRGGERPPWWPEGEPFPPQGWQRSRMRFQRRFIGIALAAFLGFAAFLALTVSILLQAFTIVTGNAPPAIVVVIAGIFVFFALTGGMRGAQRYARPIADLIGAAERVEQGDYTARVKEGNHDPRRLRSLARAFNAMSARLDQSESERRRLLADVTHELRTPLTIIQGNVEALIDGVHPADEAHFRAILDETQVLARLIDDLRTVSVAEAGALALHKEPTDLADLARDVALSFDAVAKERNVTLSVDAPPAMVAELDPIRMREVLANIVANALRYTPSGGSVRVSVAATEREVSVSVTDTGPGIAADVLPHVFDRFTKSADSPGAGLGLAIAKGLVTAHGGTIEAESPPGQGTTLRFTLPASA